MKNTDKYDTTITLSMEDLKKICKCNTIKLNNELKELCNVIELNEIENNINKNSIKKSFSCSLFEYFSKYLL